MLPGAVALELLVAQNERAAVYIGRCAAYPTGLDFELHVLAAAGAGDLDPSLNGPYHRSGRGSTYEEMLRFGVAFADGRKASNLGGFPSSGREPEGPVLWGMGGAAGAAAGIRASGCGRFRRSVRCPLSASGLRRGSPSPASRLIQSHSAIPPLARVSCSRIRPPGSGAPRGRGCRERANPASSEPRLVALGEGRCETAAFTKAELSSVTGPRLRAPALGLPPAGAAAHGRLLRRRQCGILYREPLWRVLVEDWVDGDFGARWLQPCRVQPDRRIHPNDAMRAHPPHADSDRMSADKRATGIADRGGTRSASAGRSARR